MKVLITGGTGFIGTNLTQKCFQNNWNVHVIDRDFSKLTTWKSKVKNVRFYNEDISSPHVKYIIESEKYDAVIHLAAVPRVSYSVEKPYLTTNENIAKTVKLLEYCKGNTGRFIFASSSSVYGGADILPTPESYPLSPKSPYALQKKTGEEFCKMFSSLYKMDTICLRFFNVFGPYQYGDSAYSTAVSAWCHAVKNNLPLRKDGSGEQSRDMCYVDNTCHACILAAESSMNFSGDCYNVACGDSVSNNDILNYFQEKFGNLNIQNAPFRAGDVMHTKADISKIEKDLGYKPLVKFWDGLERTLKWHNL